MSDKLPKNVSESIHQRLLNLAKTRHRPFNEILQYYAMERFLYRLSISPYVNCFILKGALMLKVWNAPECRATMDIDMLGKTSNKESNIIDQIQKIIAVEAPSDGLIFDASSISVEIITENSEYKGLRVLCCRLRLWLSLNRLFHQNRQCGMRFGGDFSRIQFPRLFQILWLTWKILFCHWFMH